MALLPLLYWHGSGIVTSKDGKTYPMYITFWPGRPQGFSGGGRREGKLVSAHLSGDGWLCIAPGNVERMQLSGTVYGGYTSSADSLFDFRRSNGESRSTSTTRTAVSSTWQENGKAQTLS